MNRLGLSSNQLKIIAILTMILDHIGYYFSYIWTNNVYLMFRIVGRISMPIFVFLIVEGYFHTNSLKNYIKRLFILALITQIILLALNIINIKFVPEYIISVTSYYNIVFSFTLILISIYSLEKILEYKNYLYLPLLLVILFIYLFINIDYGFALLSISILLYLCKKYMHTKSIYNMSISIVIILIAIISGKLNICMVLSIPFLLLYNGKLGKSSIMLKRFFYYMFPIQHLLLYSLAMIWYMKII